VKTEVFLPENIEKLLQNREFLKLSEVLKKNQNIKFNHKKVTAPLMLSPDKLKHVKKLPNIKTDSVVINLEDGVSDKKLALYTTAYILSELRNFNPNLKLIVRINPLFENGIEEINFLKKFQPDGFRIPKIGTSEDVELASKLINNQNIEIHLSIETASAWLNLNTLKINSQVKAFYLGILDLFADIGLSQSLINSENPTINYILSHFLITSKALKVQPVSFVYQDFKNTKEFTKWVEFEQKMGFDSKGVISPTQAEIVQNIHNNNSQELIKAQYIKKIYEEALSNNIHSITDDKYGFIDEPIYKGALSVINNSNN
jgi:citrate lyase subunit beta/citryl-CoA lyase